MLCIGEEIYILQINDKYTFNVRFICLIINKYISYLIICFSTNQKSLMAEHVIYIYSY